MAAAQSPGYVNEKASNDYSKQLNSVTGGKVGIRKSSDAAVVYELLKKRNNEQAHHKGLLSTLGVLYEGLDDAETAELRGYLNQFGSQGNMIGNLINIPQGMHQGGIHNYAIQKGYQIVPGRAPEDQIGFALDIMEAKDMPLAYRKHVGMKYMTEAVPDMVNYINDRLTADPTMNEVLDMSSVRAAQAAEAQLYLSEKSKKMPRR